MGYEGKGCVLVGSLESFCGQAVYEMVPSGMEDMEEKSFCHARTTENAEAFYYRAVFRGDEVVECPELNELAPTVEEMVR